MKTYTILFLSSAEISIPLLEKLAHDDRFNIIGLVCQPDKPAGRDLKLKKPPTKIRAEELNITVFQPNKLKYADDLLDTLCKDRPDFLITFAYGQILNSDWLNLPVIAPLNIHTSLLPKYRGAAPIQAALLSGDEKTGISLMKMVKKMDEGPIAFQHEMNIEDHMFADILHDELSELSSQKIPDDLIKIAQDSSIFKDQIHDKASYTKKISKEDGFVDFKSSADDILLKFRAYTPWPGLWTIYLGKRLKLLDITKDETALSPGDVRCIKHSAIIGTLDGSINVKQLQLESKQSMHSDQFSIGHPEFCQAVLPS